MSTSVKLSAAEGAGLFGPIYRDVLRALEFELAGMCEVDDVDYSEALDLCRLSGTDNLGIPRTFIARDAIASNIAISGTSKTGSMGVVRAARRINEAGEQRVLDMIKNALSLCGKRFRHSRIAILGFTGLESPSDTKPNTTPNLHMIGSEGEIESLSQC